MAVGLLCFGFWCLTRKNQEKREYRSTGMCCSLPVPPPPWLSPDDPHVAVFSMQIRWVSKHVPSCPNPTPHSPAHTHTCTMRAHTRTCTWLSLSASPGAKTELMVMSEGDRGKKKKSSGRLAGLGLWQQAANSFISCSAEYKSAETF